MKFDQGIPKERGEKKSKINIINRSKFTIDKVILTLSYRLNLVLALDQ